MELLYVLAYILIGVATAIGFGRTGLFDYSPTPSQVKPRNLLYMTTFFWPVFWLFFIFGLIVEAVQWIHRNYQKVAKVRR